MAGAAAGDGSGTIAFAPLTLAGQYSNAKIDGNRYCRALYHHLFPKDKNGGGGGAAAATTSIEAGGTAIAVVAAMTHAEHDATNAGQGFSSDSDKARKMTGAGLCQTFLAEADTEVSRVLRKRAASLKGRATSVGSLVDVGGDYVETDLKAIAAAINGENDVSSDTVDGAVSDKVLAALVRAYEADLEALLPCIERLEAIGELTADNLDDIKERLINTKDVLKGLSEQARHADAMPKALLKETKSSITRLQAVIKALQGAVKLFQEKNKALQETIQPFLTEKAISSLRIALASFPTEKINKTIDAIYSRVGVLARHLKTAGDYEQAGLLLKIFEDRLKGVETTWLSGADAAKLVPDDSEETQVALSYDFLIREVPRVPDDLTNPEHLKKLQRARIMGYATFGMTYVNAVLALAGDRHAPEDEAKTRLIYNDDLKAAAINFVNRIGNRLDLLTEKQAHLLLYAFKVCELAPVLATRLDEQNKSGDLRDFYQVELDRCRDNVKWIKALLNAKDINFEAVYKELKALDKLDCPRLKHLQEQLEIAKDYAMLGMSPHAVATVMQTDIPGQYTAEVAVPVTATTKILAAKLTEQSKAHGGTLEHIERLSEIFWVRLCSMAKDYMLPPEGADTSFQLVGRQCPTQLIGLAGPPRNGQFRLVGSIDGEGFSHSVGVNSNGAIANLSEDEACATRLSVLNAYQLVALARQQTGITDLPRARVVLLSLNSNWEALLGKKVADFLGEEFDKFLADSAAKWVDNHDPRIVHLIQETLAETGITHINLPVNAMRGRSIPNYEALRERNWGQAESDTAKAATPAELTVAESIRADINRLAESLTASGPITDDKGVQYYIQCVAANLDAIQRNIHHYENPDSSVSPATGELPEMAVQALQLFEAYNALVEAHKALVKAHTVPVDSAKPVLDIKLQPYFLDFGCKSGKDRAAIVAYFFNAVTLTEQACYKKYRRVDWRKNTAAQSEYPTILRRNLFRLAYADMAGFLAGDLGATYGCSAVKSDSRATLECLLEKVAGFDKADIDLIVAIMMGPIAKLNHGVELPEKMAASSALEQRLVAAQVGHDRRQTVTARPVKADGHAGDDDPMCRAYSTSVVTASLGAFLNGEVGAAGRLSAVADTEGLERSTSCDKA